MPEIISIAAYRFEELEPDVQLKVIEAHRLMRDEAGYTTEDISWDMDQRLGDTIWTPLQVRWGGLHTQGRFLGFEGSISLAQLMKESGPMQMRRELQAPDPRVHAPLLVEIATKRDELNDPYWTLTVGDHSTKVEALPDYAVLSSEAGYYAPGYRQGEYSYAEIDHARHQAGVLGQRVRRWIRRLEDYMWEALEHYDRRYREEWFLREDIEENYSELRYTADGKVLNIIDGQLA